MKTSVYIRIGLVMSLIYYFLDAFLDYLLFYHDMRFVEVLATGVPPTELYNRFTAIILIIVALLLARLYTMQRPAYKAKNRKEVFSDLNNVSVIELVGHQLKTSLSTIIGFTKLMNDPDINDNTRMMYSEYVYSSSTNLLGLFNNLVDLNRLVEGKYPLIIETCHANKMLNELKNKYETDITRKSIQRITLNLNIPKESQHILLNTDYRKLNKILSKLLENAIEMTQGGTIEFGYTLESGNTIRFFVSDEGAGRSMENLEQSFNRYFSQLNSTDASFELGALRMAVIRKFAEMIGGKVWSESPDGTGSTFYLELKLSEQEQELADEKGSEKKTPDWSGLKILIAEDVEPNYLLLKELLKPTQAEIIWAHDGKEAVEYYNTQGNEIGLILMDIVMPEMDGFEAAQKIREINPNVPIIGQTAYSLEFEKNPDQLKSFNDYVTKPIWYHELINIMSKYV